MNNFDPLSAQFPVRIFVHTPRLKRVGLPPFSDLPQPYPTPKLRDFLENADRKLQLL